VFELTGEIQTKQRSLSSSVGWDKVKTCKRVFEFFHWFNRPFQQRFNFIELCQSWPLGGDSIRIGRHFHCQMAALPVIA
jgi:hypothetical protein